MCWSLWWRRSVENLKSLFGLGTRSRGAESLSQLIPVVPGLLVVSNGCVWKCCVPLNPMVLLIIIPFLNGYFIGNIPYFQTPKSDFTCSNYHPWCEPTRFGDFEGNCTWSASFLSPEGPHTEPHTGREKHAPARARIASVPKKTSNAK